MSEGANLRKPERSIETSTSRGIVALPQQISTNCSESVPPNGSRLSCGRPARRRKAAWRRPALQRTATERDDISIRVLDVEILRPPCRRRERPENRYAIRDALRVERFDAVHAGRRIEMLILAAVLAFGATLRRLLQMQFQPVQLADRIEPVPRLTKREADLPIVGHRALQVVNKELGSERRHPRLSREVGHFVSGLMWVAA